MYLNLTQLTQLIYINNNDRLYQVSYKMVFEQNYCVSIYYFINQKNENVIIASLIYNSKL